MIRLFILLLFSVFTFNVFAKDLKLYKYQGYKDNTEEVVFESSVSKMRPNMFDGKDINGILYKPGGQGPFDAVVILHGGGGIFPYQLDWARLLREEGYVVLFVDSYCTRDILCDHDSNDNTAERRQAVSQWQSVTPIQRIADSVGALEYLHQYDFINLDRISLMGFSWGATSALFTNNPRMQKMFPQQYKSLIGFYPNSKHWSKMGRMSFSVKDINVSIPTLILAGVMDELESVEIYNKLEEKALKKNFPLKIKLYDNSFRKFDEKREKRVVKVNNKPFTKGYNAKAHLNSINVVLSFLKK